jgi:hypothetical protein
MKVEKFTALEAHRAGKLHLAPGYELEHGADILLLRSNDGSVVAAFSAKGATTAEVARTAEEDYMTHRKSSALGSFPHRDLQLPEGLRVKG